jgi:glycosyltransferase involved in cell wall biosynthesis
MVGPFGLHPNKTMSSRAFGLARQLVAREHDVCLFMPPWQTPQEGDRHWQQDGVVFRYIPLRGGMFGIARRLLQETLAWQPHVVHCFKPKAYSGLVAWWLWHFQRRRLPLVVDSDDWEGWGGWNDRASYNAVQKYFFSWQERWGMSHCHQLTVASKTLQSIAWSHGIAQEKVLYLPNGSGLPTGDQPTSADIAAQRQILGIADRPSLLLYSRLFEFETTRLAQILAGVKAALPEVAIVSIGTSLFADDAAQLQDELIKTAVLPALIDLGWIEPEQLPMLLSSADVALYLMDDTLLNRTKCPVKLADLIALGSVVVAEAVGQVSEYVISGHTGQLCPSGDVSGLTNNTVSLLENTSRRSRMSARAKAHYQTNFAWDLLVERLLHTYQKALARF